MMSAPPINGVVETCLYSHDLPRSVRFYQEKLGFRLLESGERLCVFRVADKQALLIFLEAGGDLHVAFAISKGDFAAWEAHLVAQGIAIESKVSWPMGGESLYFRDPDNHLVELVTPGIWEVY
jgi:catechol 2,3-dioxygenase-like lactoylglutathione lyase family enzyme